MSTGFDVIVIGGGISGLYLLYRLVCDASQGSRFLLLESTGRLGGRVDTYTDSHMSVEAGAGRFGSHHHLFMGLLKKLKLDKKCVPISSDVVYIDSSVVDSTTLPVLLGKVMKASRAKSLAMMRSMSFIDFAKTVVSARECKYILDSFGYYSELVIMNAHDAIKLMEHLGPDTQYYGLSGGLSQVVDELKRQIIAIGKRRGHTIQILLKTEVTQIYLISKSFVNETTIDSSMTDLGWRVCTARGREYMCNHCVCALPQTALKRFSVFKPIRTLLDSVICAPLCRIYTELDVGITKKFTTNNNLRMFIPIDAETGLTMVSYSDNKFADFWNELYEAKGVRGVNTEIVRLLSGIFGGKVSVPKYTRVFYWGCGVGYWKVGVNSRDVAKKIVNPFPNMYICGEHYSEMNQQWMEGALDTAEHVITCIGPV